MTQTIEELRKEEATLTGQIHSLKTRKAAAVRKIKDSCHTLYAVEVAKGISHATYQKFRIETGRHRNQQLQCILECKREIHLLCVKRTELKPLIIHHIDSSRHKILVDKLEATFSPSELKLIYPTILGKIRV